MSPHCDGSKLHPLPQYGFGPTLSFAELVKDNHFLFRVYTPRSSGSGNKFIGRKFNASYTAYPAQMSSAAPRSSDVTYADVAKHMDWTTRIHSAYVSTSFSFAWAIWESVRRYEKGTKHDVHVAIIDATILPEETTITAAHILRKATANERHRDHWKWYRFALESQDVLVYGSIPQAAVLASIPLFTILQALPSYFLHSSGEFKTLENLAWDYASTKPSYRKFCHNLSQKHASSDAETRFCDSSTGSVQLAMAFLRPWFHEIVHKDHQDATGTLCTLASAIAQWPSQKRACDHVNLLALIESVVALLASSVRASGKPSHEGAIVRPQTPLLVLTPDHAPRPLSLSDHSVARLNASSSEIAKPTDQLLVETTSCLVSGFIVGSLFALYIISQRRTPWVGLT